MFVPSFASHIPELVTFFNILAFIANLSLDNLCIIVSHGCCSGHLQWLATIKRTQLIREFIFCFSSNILMPSFFFSPLPRNWFKQSVHGFSGYF